MSSDEKMAQATYPKVSVLWLNYNSMHVIETTKKSLDSLANLDYPNFELILIDNGSTDGSKEVIEKYLRNQKFGKSEVTFVKLSKNVGFTDGVNAGYNRRDRDSEYVALTHNDVVAKKGYLREVVGYMRSHEGVGAAQGIVARLGYPSKVDSAGFMIDEALDLFRLSESKELSFKKPLYIAFVEGAMPVYNVEAVKSAVKSERELFVPGAFMYYLEDVFVSIELWSKGYKCVLLPFLTGGHLRMAVSAQTESLDLAYYRIRNQVALLCMTNSADKLRVILQNLRRAAISRGNLAVRQMLMRSLIDGIRNGRRLRKIYGEIDLYKTPMLKKSVRSRFRI
jgi:GT2 family glycosyltransferase